AILSEAPVLGIKLKTSFAATNRVASISADLEYFQPGTADHQIVVVITEDSIFSKQADYTLQPDYVLNYCQKHVLRKSVTSGIWGEQIKPGTIFVGEKFTKNFDTGIDPAWDVSQCHVVVYVLDNASKEILQVEEAHF
ncbi:MAG TPA: Omp28-related outer membrane protein, partial [Bacteroidetes bacterium]|nr:Omp28-related outer membrane protein [Bacteroidota bacterium]